MTTGGNLPAKHVIHTVGPIWSGGGRKEAETLASCYRESLKLAKKHGLRTVAFPSISTGAYGYPIAEAATVALNTILTFLNEEQGIDKVMVILFGDEARKIYEGVMDRSNRQE
jgi:O-acetyl-ADP-ribose deacetylase (regulator of RNase III)